MTKKRHAATSQPVVVADDAEPLGDRLFAKRAR
jgi:hypothetical protein